MKPSQCQRSLSSLLPSVPPDEGSVNLLHYERALPVLKKYSALQVHVAPLQLPQLHSPSDRNRSQVSPTQGKEAHGHVELSRKIPHCVPASASPSPLQRESKTRRSRSLDCSLDRNACQHAKQMPRTEFQEDDGALDRLGNSRRSSGFALALSAIRAQRKQASTEPEERRPDAIYNVLSPQAECKVLPRVATTLSQPEAVKAEAASLPNSAGSSTKNCRPPKVLDPITDTGSNTALSDRDGCVLVRHRGETEQSPRTRASGVEVQDMLSAGAFQDRLEQQPSPLLNPIQDCMSDFNKSTSGGLLKVTIVNKPAIDNADESVFPALAKRQFLQTPKERRSVSCDLNPVNSECRVDSRMHSLEASNEQSATSSNETSHAPEMIEGNTESAGCARMKFEAALATVRMERRRLPSYNGLWKLDHNAGVYRRGRMSDRDEAESTNYIPKLQTMKHRAGAPCIR
mmetsp:Transcript_31810/g.59804  ORF Transcript_31810/g.59804 Transcript_31810/m.59804 type:complete len:458 (-) Transcript_31810:256-1629(-)